MPDNLNVVIGADTTKLRADLALAQASLRQFARELKTAADAARQTGETTQLQAAAQRYQAVEVRVRALGQQIRGAAQAHAAAMPVVAGLGVRFTDLGGKLREVGTAFTEFADRTFPHFREIAVLSIAGVSAALLKLGKDAAASTLDLHDQAAALGATTDQVQAFKLAAAKEGLDSDAMVKDLERLNLEWGRSLTAQGKTANSLEALKGTYMDAFGVVRQVQQVFQVGVGMINQQDDAFRALDININKYKRDTGGIFSLYRDLAIQIDKITDSARKASFAEEFFGKGWARQIPFLKGLSDAMREALAEIIPVTAAEEKQAQAFQGHLATLQYVFGRMKDIVFGTLGEAFLPVFTGITKMLRDNQKDIEEWGRSVSGYLLPLARDLVKLLGEGMTAKFETVALTSAIGTLRGLGDAVRIASDALKSLIGILDDVAAALNAVFGTKFTGQGILIAGIILNLTGVFTALAAAIKLVGVASAFFIATPLGLTLTALALAGLEIYQNWTPIKGLFDSIWQTWVEISNWITATFLGAIDSLINKAKAAASFLSGLVGAGSSAPARSSATAPLPPAGNGQDFSGGSNGMASGGLVRGPGTSTSDSVLARLSAGEFVLNAASVRALGVGLLHSLNSFAAGGLVGAPPIGFAAGGLVAAGSSSGRPVHLHLGSQSYALQGSESVVDALVSHAYSQNMRSAGVKPTWFGGRSGGG